MLFTPILSLLVFLNGQSMILNANETYLSDEGFVPLFNGENFDGWYLKIRSDDQELAEKVFSVNDGMVHIFKDFPEEYELNTGGNKTHGLFYTNKTFSRFIFRFEYKWVSVCG